MEAMSFASMSAMVFLVMTPSTMMSGVLPPTLRFVEPRSRMVGVAPGLPVPREILAPDTLPASAATGEEAGTCLSCSSVTLATEKGITVLEVALATPVTTTSSRRNGSTFRTKSWLCGPGLTMIGRFCRT
jgi:hypothetical protein